MNGPARAPLCPATCALAIAAAAIAAMLWSWPALWGGLLSDDWLIGAMFEVGPRGRVVDWGEVFADFGRSWLGIDNSFYRPLLSVSFALDVWLGGSPLVLHATNLLLHAAVAAMAALLCALHAQQGPQRTAAALAGGVFVALHPLAVEPVAWIAARNSGLEVFFSLAAACSFSVWLRSGRAACAWSTALFALLALATKESAIALPVALLALDLLHEPARAWRTRVWLHLRFVPIWVGYLALRLLLFGSIAGQDITGEAIAGQAISGQAIAGQATGDALAPTDPVTSLLDKLLVLLVPHGTTLAPTSTAAWLIGAWLGGVLLCALCARRALATVLVGTGWLALFLLPAASIALHDDLGGARLLYGAVPILAIVTIAATGAARRGVAWLGPLALLAATVGLAPLSHALLARYEAAWADMRDATRGIAELAPGTAVERPLALLAMPQNAPGIPPCNPNAWFPFAERPVQQTDVPMVSLGWLTVATPGSETLMHDASALRALWHADAVLAAWHGESRRFLVQRKGDAARGAVELAVEAPGDPSGEAIARDPAGAVGGHAIEALELEFDRPVQRGRVAWRTSVELPAGLGSAGFTLDGEARRTVTVDLSHEIGLVSLATLGLPVREFAIRVDAAAAGASASGAPPRVLRARLLDRLPELEVARVGGARIAIDELAAGLPRPQRAVAEGEELRLILLCAHTALPVAVVAGDLRMTARVLAELATVRRLSRQDRVWFFWQLRAPSGAAGARSAVDWFGI